MLPMVGIARERGLTTAFVPEPDAAEAALVDGVEVIPVSTLGALAAHLRGLEPIEAHVLERSGEVPDAPAPEGVDFRDVRGQEHVKRALEVAAAGGHNVLMLGPPGAGKTLLARATPTILPSMATDEALEVTRIYSVAGMLPAGTSLMRSRPFRSPHHTVSHAGLVGGGRVPRPGEITLSHRRVASPDRRQPSAP
jgi:magnesium chelatase family protein